MYRVKYGNKYGAESHIYNGIAYHSKKEAGYAAGLDLRKRAGDIKDWERQVKVPLEVNGCHVTNYYVDFKIIHNDDSIEFIEVKGFETAEWRLKWRLFEITHKEIYQNSTITVVK